VPVIWRRAEWGQAKERKEHGDLLLYQVPRASGHSGRCALRTTLCTAHHGDL
jgi:hypothetical protein